MAPRVKKQAATPNGPRRVTARQKQVFLEALAEGLPVVRAATRAKAHRATLHRHKLADPVFAAAWAEAYEVGGDLVDEEIHRRAIDGVEKPVTVAGAREVVREYSDAILILMAKARKPNVYRERTSTEVTGANGGPVSLEVVDVDNAIRTLVGDLAGRPKAPADGRTAQGALG